MRQLALGHGLRLFPEQLTATLVQTVWAAVVTAGHPIQQLLRLSGVPFVMLAALSLYQIARRLGGDHFWSGIAALSLLCAPIFLGVSTSFMTEPFYLGLMLAASAAAVAWLVESRGRAACVVFTTLACLERQHGLGIVAALTLGMFIKQRQGSVQRDDWAWLAGSWLLAAGALVVPGVFGLVTASGATLRDQLLRPDLFLMTRAFRFAPRTLGFLLLPFMGALFAARARLPRRHLVILVVLPLVGLAAVTDAVYLALTSTYPLDNEWTPMGLNPTSLNGPKVNLFPGALFTFFQSVSVATFAGLTIWSARAWAAFRWGAAEVFLIGLALLEFLPMLRLGGLERYYLPVAAPLLALAAAMASRYSSGRIGRGWAVAAVACLLPLYVAGEQDYQSWQAARDRAVHMAFASYAPQDVACGYECFAVYVQVPAYEQTGRLVRPVTPDALAPSLLGPVHPRAKLEFAARGDPRPGVDYNSLAPGRIVIIPLQ